MNHLTFVWDQSQNQHRHRRNWREVFVWVGLFCAALWLFSFNLDSPTLNGSESIIAQVAKEVEGNHFLSSQWRSLTLWGDAYHDQPPLGIFLIALSYFWGGVSEETTRLSGALLAAISVPLLYNLSKEAFARQRPALFSALIFLTLFPVVCQGRLALLDGAVIFFEVLTIWCVLRSRRDLRWSLGVGLSLSGLLLTHSVLGLLLGLTIIIFLAWDTPRLLTSGYFSLGLFLGVLPAIAWYSAQWIDYGPSFVESLFWLPFQTHQGLFRGLLGRSGLELALMSLPWSIFAISGLQLAKKSLNWGWAKLIVVWGGLSILVFLILPLPDKDYLIPLYPPLALAGGIALADVSHASSEQVYPKFWGRSLLLLSGMLGLVGLSLWLNFPLDARDLSHQFPLILTLAAMALTLGTTGILLSSRNSQFIAVLFWGLYVSLMLLVSSPYWTGEISPPDSIQPLAAMLRERVPPHQVVYGDLAQENPALNFYSDRRVIPTTPETLLRYWHTQPDPYLLITLDTWQKLPLEYVHPLDEAPPHWYLITRMGSND